MSEPCKDEISKIEISNDMNYTVPGSYLLHLKDLERKLSAGEPMNAEEMRNWGQWLEQAFIGHCEPVPVYSGICLSADQWEIFDEEGYEEVAKELNAACNRAVDKALTKIRGGVEAAAAARDAINEADRVFAKYRKYGALDSEPMYHLEKEINRALGVRDF